ncbi:ACT domain-containing protein [Mobiluncus curtisii]|uniref:ACT domain protein n=2 Tax=Mobiluncus curtisii TaxID=2051 RepID=D6ZG67_MOBCV|nr:ACT domain-containing protein [Mobiluncus curtisii]ADI67625.1 ACT domain protein [Mobiluncus curtisii ATCC 43063]EFL94244.1 ACT domain protein [Mobiluncus curtisii subsp. curtisii ATCC 35241]MCU9987673.1 ACT domain-containing protein [Mobiluncus curtisii]MCV0000645.1 ACT domain-containing protein [Mobiluncus curtisii]MCV0021494.1 ACT domain-containing protein [Mobiluncus curtisii]
MKAIMTVTGLDHTGIIAAVATACAAQKANITNVSQTLMGSYFTMIMQLELDDIPTSLTNLQEAMHTVEQAQNLEIRVQAEAIFNAMHTL